MIDTQTNRSIRVSGDGDVGPYIMVPVPQLGAIRTLLDKHEVPYWVDAEAIRLNGTPAVAVVNLGRGILPDPIQRLLDDNT